MIKTTSFYCTRWLRIRDFLCLYICAPTPQDAPRKHVAFVIVPRISKRLVTVWSDCQPTSPTHRRRGKKSPVPNVLLIDPEIKVIGALGVFSAPKKQQKIVIGG